MPKQLKRSVSADSQRNHLKDLDIDLDVDSFIEERPSALKLQRIRHAISNKLLEKFSKQLSLHDEESKKKITDVDDIYFDFKDGLPFISEGFQAVGMLLLFF